MFFANKKKNVPRRGSLSKKNEDETARLKNDRREMPSEKSTNFHIDLPVNAMEQNQLQPLVSPAYEDLPVWNILPSYQLYESTFSKTISPTEEDLRYNPPNYEHSSPELEISYGRFFGDRNGPEFPLWDNSILGNIQKLKKLEDFTPKRSSGLKIEIHITDGSARNGTPGKEIDVLSYEYQQGDTIQGYVLTENITKENISFDMFSVILEGKVTVMGDQNDSKRAVIFYKFLNMFDYFASWSPADLNEDPNAVKIDPVDGTTLQFPMEKYFAPGVVYKKYFNFKLPERLLECACDSSIQRHCEMVPSIGLDRDQFMQNVKRLRQRNLVKQKGAGGNSTVGSVAAEFSFGPSKSNTIQQDKSKKPTNSLNERVKDLSFSDTAISYSVEARVIGRTSQFIDLKPEEKDEFLLMEECSCYLRMIPRELLNYQIEPEVLEADAKIMYNNLVSRIEEKIKLGNSLLDQENTSLSDRLDRALSISKKSQLYTKDGNEKINNMLSNDLNEFTSTVPIIRKQTITSNTKVMGLLNISAPKNYYQVKYIPALKFIPRENLRNLSTILDLPIDLTFVPSADVTKPPEIKDICTEVIAVTYRSKKYPVPIEITPDLIFKNLPNGKDDFEHNVSNVFKKYLTDITNVSKQLSYEVLGIDSQLIMDIKSLVGLNFKYDHFKVNDTQMIYENGISSWESGSQSSNSISKRTFFKRINIMSDLKKILSKETSKSNENLQKASFTLIPNFQNCIIGRLYFLNIIIKFHNHENVHLKVPFNIEL